MIGGLDHMHHMQHVYLEGLESVDNQRDRRSLGQAVNEEITNSRVCECMKHGIDSWR